MLHVHESAGFVRLQQLTLTGGREEDAPGGAIHNAASLRLDRVTLTDNALSFATERPCYNVSETLVCSKGAALYNRGKLEVERSRIVGNSAGSNGWGGALFNYGSAATTVITRSYFEDNEAFYGGTIANHLGRVDVQNSTIYHRRASTRGARSGVAVWNGGTVLLRNVTVLADAEVSLLENAIGSSFVLANTAVAHPSERAPRLCAGSFTSYGGNWLGGDSLLPADYVLPCTLDPITTSPTSPARDVIARFGFYGPNSWDDLPPDVAVPLPASTIGSVPKLSVVDHGAGIDGCPWRDQTGAERPRDGDGRSGAQCDPGAYELPAPL